MTLTATQHRFLTFYLSGPPARVVWLDKDAHHIGPVTEPFSYHPEAAAVLVYRLSDGSESFAGDAMNKTMLGVAKLRGLEHLWAVPLRELNAEGLALARGPRPDRMVGISVRLPWSLNREWAAEARAEGITVSALIRRAMAERKARTSA